MAVISMILAATVTAAAMAPMATTMAVAMFPAMTTKAAVTFAMAAKAVISLARHVFISLPSAWTREER